MTAARAERRFAFLVVYAIVGTLIVAALCSCSTLKRLGWTAGGAAGGAVLGSSLGPGGTAAGAAIGGGAGQLVGENAALRDGDLIGKDAADDQARRFGAAPKPSIFDELKRYALWIAAGYLALKFLGTPRGRENVRAFFVALGALKIPTALGALLKADGWAHTQPKPKPRTPMAMPQEH